MSGYPFENLNNKILSIAVLNPKNQNLKIRPTYCSKKIKALGDAHDTSKKFLRHWAAPNTIKKSFARQWATPKVLFQKNQ
jgi:hypothetical protein